MVIYMLLYHHRYSYIQPLIVIISIITMIVDNNNNNNNSALIIRCTYVFGFEVTNEMHEMCEELNSILLLNDKNDDINDNNKQKSSKELQNLLNNSVRMHEERILAINKNFIETAKHYNLDFTHPLMQNLMITIKKTLDNISEFLDHTNDYPGWVDGKKK